MALARQESAKIVMTSPIDFEDTSTWPAGIKAALDKGTPAGLGDANQILAHERILAFHCTRLLPFEAAEIPATGLYPPSPTFLERRINRARDAGYLSAYICARLLAKNQAMDANRVGVIRFVTMKALLKEQSQVHRFFESWGGEALYFSHEKDPITGPKLKSIGEPYIVAAFLPLNKLEEFKYGLAGDFANKLLNDATKGEAGKAQLNQVGVRGRVPPEWVNKLLSFQDPEFESLTLCHEHRWNLSTERHHS